jgi:hypothetical protein
MVGLGAAVNLALSCPLFRLFAHGHFLDLGEITFSVSIMVHG